MLGIDIVLSLASLVVQTQDPLELTPHLIVLILQQLALLLQPLTLLFQQLTLLLQFVALALSAIALTLYLTQLVTKRAPD